MEEGDPASANGTRPLVFAYYVTGHGLGHATRVVEVTRHLIAAGHIVHVVTGAPEKVFRREIDSPLLHVRKVLLDSGAIQSDALTVNRVASLEQYFRTAILPRSRLLAEESAWLKDINANLVVSDVVPIACACATQAGIPSVCVSNFSWDFIYSEYLTVAGHHHRSLIWQIAEDYSQALLLIRLPGFCPMPAFRDVLDVPLVVRPVRRSRKEVRQELGVSDETRLLLFNFGGQDANWQVRPEFLPPGWKCLVCTTLPIPELPPNFIKPDPDAYTPDLIAACDCMLGKIGYGTASESLAYKVPFVFIRRDFFNEEPFLRKMLEYFRCGVEMKRRDFFDGRWAPYLERACAIKPNYNGKLNGGEVVADALQEVALGRFDALKRPSSGVGRLRDAIVMGYQLHRMPGRSDIDVPEWYTSGQFPSNMPSPLADYYLSPHSPVPDVSQLKLAAAGVRSDLGVDFFELLHGDMLGLQDTEAFLRTLSRLEADGSVEASDKAEKPQARERLAAGGLFRWDSELYVTRAPGRLDVMGGVADYSGSMVLQMPIAEACHVALQRTAPQEQRLWKHSLARQQAKGQGQLRPVLQVVSFGSEKTNRAPTFDMDIDDFLDASGDPISYIAARKYFEQDPSQKWAAYVAGTLLVLMREKGVRFSDGLSVLVHSAVPEGKGVSSSAAVEVATMQAVAAAHSLSLSSRELAILCQKVENEVVGAPCGVMDQMASSCGEANKLLAMVCQPAEVLGHVPIPDHLQFFGLDSGIRHSVGGADYGSVRVGAFMGRRILELAAKQAGAAAVLQDGLTPDLPEPQGNAAAEDAQLPYLCNVPPHRFETLYAPLLPKELNGASFLQEYGPHNDPVTTINPAVTYAVHAPTSHPIYENFRVKTFSQLLNAASSDMQLEMLGELMYQSHASYSRCGLGSDGTDRLVGLTQQSATLAERQEGGSLFGAKITGGGSGGTVCVMGRAGEGSREAIREIRKRYKVATGHIPYLFEGSSPGAGQFGHLRIRRRPTSPVATWEPLMQNVLS